MDAVSPRPSANVTYQSEKKRLHGKPLTDEEKQVLQLIVWGYSIVEIADELGIPKRRAKFRVESIRFKAGCDRKRDLVLWARMRHPRLFQALPKVPS